MVAERSGKLHVVDFLKVKIPGSFKAGGPKVELSFFNVRDRRVGTQDLAQKTWEGVGRVFKNTLGQQPWPIPNRRFGSD